jgi:hypothetical protein
MGGKAALQAPHRPVSARCLAGMRFGLAQEGQLRTMGIFSLFVEDAAESRFVATGSL